MIQFMPANHLITNVLSPKYYHHSLLLKTHSLDFSRNNECALRKSPGFQTDLLYIGLSALEHISVDLHKIWNHCSSRSGDDVCDVSGLNSWVKKLYVFVFNDCICFPLFNSAAIGSPAAIDTSLIAKCKHMQTHANMNVTLFRVSANQISVFSITQQSR